MNAFENTYVQQKETGEANRNSELAEMIKAYLSVAGSMQAWDQFKVFTRGDFQAFVDDLELSSSTPD